MMNTKTALVTGASRGLGLAVARELAHRGWAIIINARGEKALETARAELSQHSTVVAVAGDIASIQTRLALATAAHTLGGIDALVNNASLLGPKPSPRPRLLDYAMDELETVYRVNVFAPLALIQAVHDQLKPGAGILNITSDAGREVYAGWGGYGSSKAALEHLSAVLAVEEPQLRVYWVDPGDMRTQMHQEAYPGEDISDRPLPEVSVPGIVALIEGEYPSGRYMARDVATRVTA